MAFDPLLALDLAQHEFDGGGVFLDGFGGVGDGLLGLRLRLGGLLEGLQPGVGAGHLLLGSRELFRGGNGLRVIAGKVGGLLRLDGGKLGFGGIELGLQPGIIGVLLQLCLEVVHLRLLFLLLPQQVLPAGIVLETLRCAGQRFIVGGLRGFLRILGIGHILLQGGFTAADLLEGGFGGLQRGLGGFQLGTQLGAGKLQRLQLGIFYRGKMGTGVIFTGIVAIAQIYHVIVLGQHGLNGLDLRRGEGGAEGGLILGIGQLLGSGHQLGIGGAALLLQLLFGVVDLPARILELLFGIGQGAIHGRQHLVIQLIDFGLIQLHTDLAFHQTAAGNGRHAIHPLQCRDDGGGGKLRKLLPGHIIAIHRQYHDGQHIGIDLHEHRAAGGLGQGVGDLIKAGVHFDHGGIHAGAFLKFQHHDTDIFLRDTGDILDAAGGSQGAFQRFGHALLHLLRTGADVGGIGDGIGQIHIRQEVGGHIDERHDTEDKHQHHADEYGHGLFDTETRQHRGFSISGG